jgi:hypothetical protein
MILTRRFILSAFFGYLLVVCFMASPVQAEDFVTGFNVVNPYIASVADQDAILGQLKTARVHVIRVYFKPDDKSVVDFAKRANAQGIKIELIVDVQYSPNAPTRPYQPEEFPNMWGGHPLSFADPERSRTYFRSLIKKLEANGIVLEGLELGNEINWAAFNQDFPLPGDGKNFGLDDLYHDPEGQRIAKGFLRYLKVLAVLKDARDHSQLNRHTPIISAGLADFGREQSMPKKEDAVTINATLQFLRANGLDNFVDAYGIHIYPSDKTTPSNRKMFLDQTAVTECYSANSTTGKPCWITEWGFQNKDTSCPPDETERTALVREMIDDFRDLAQQDRLVGALYFDWSRSAKPGDKQMDPFSVYRCGVLTESGKLVLAP